jgi:hypothetical protein
MGKAKIDPGDRVCRLNLDLDHDLNLFYHTFRSELARINPINVEEK